MYDLKIVFCVFPAQGVCVCVCVCVCICMVDRDNSKNIDALWAKSEVTLF